MRQAKAVKVSQETGGLQITKPQSVFLSNEILDLRCKTTLKGLHHFSSLPPFNERAGAMHIASVPVRQWTGTALLNQYEFGPASVGSTQLALRSGADL